MTVTYNPYSFSVHDDPYSVYARLRDETPAYWNDELRFWALSRFDDVFDGFRDHETYSSAGGISLESRRPIDRTNPNLTQLIELDPPDHTVLRKLVNRVFTVSRVAAMEDEVRRVVGTYIDAVVERGQGDLVADITGPFPMDVISAVLGIAEGDRAELRSLADKILVREDGSMAMPPEALDGFFGLLRFFTDDLPRQRSGHGQGLFADLATVEFEGRRLTDEELLGFCVLFTIAGHETTTKLVANAIEVLSRHRDQLDQLVRDPSLIPGAVEETLRYHTSTQYMHRTMAVDRDLHGQRMRQGDSVLLLIGAANHDPREFGPTADTFDIHRRPERHLSFGHGAHFCLGASLARLESRVALEELLRRLPDLDVDHDAKVRFHSGNVTGWTELPITFDTRARVS